VAVGDGEALGVATVPGVAGAGEVVAELLG
jgi:hypothetical protein